jgi:hypothetical protein
MDFLRNRSFRQTTMVHAARRVERHVTPDRVQLLWVAGLTHPHRKVPDLRWAQSRSSRRPTVRP